MTPRTTCGRSKSPSVHCAVGAGPSAAQPSVQPLSRGDHRTTSTGRTGYRPAFCTQSVGGWRNLVPPGRTPPGRTRTWSRGCLVGYPGNFPHPGVESVPPIVGVATPRPPRTTAAVPLRAFRGVDGCTPSPGPCGLLVLTNLRQRRARACAPTHEPGPCIYSACGHRVGASEQTRSHMGHPGCAQ